MRDQDYQAFLKLDLSPYGGEWIAICEQKVISHGKNIKQVYHQAKKKYPEETPQLVLVPGKEKWIFYHGPSI